MYRAGSVQALDAPARFSQLHARPHPSCLPTGTCTAWHQIARGAVGYRHFPSRFVLRQDRSDRPSTSAACVMSAAFNPGLLVGLPGGRLAAGGQFADEERVGASSRNAQPVRGNQNDSIIP